MSTNPHRRRLTGLLAAVALVAAGGLATGAVGATASAPTNTDPRVKTRSPFPTPRVVDARFASHGGPRGFDRVVFDLRGKAPGYNVRYVSKLTFCGSGKTVTIPGSRFLSVTLTPAQAHNDRGRDVYEGPGQGSTFRPGMATIKSMRMICDFEGHVTFGLGLDHKAGFRVGTLSDPTRIYVDVAH